jgi:hypothetical protein
MRLPVALESAREEERADAVLALAPRHPEVVDPAVARVDVDEADDPVSVLGEEDVALLEPAPPYRVRELALREALLVESDGPTEVARLASAHRDMWWGVGGRSMSCGKEAEERVRALLGAEAVALEEHASVGVVGAERAEDAGDAPRAGDLDGALEERAADLLPPEGRRDERPEEVGVVPCRRDLDAAEAGDGPVLVRHEQGLSRRPVPAGELGVHLPARLPDRISDLLCDPRDCAF